MTAGIPCFFLVSPTYPTRFLCPLPGAIPVRWYFCFLFTSHPLPSPYVQCVSLFCPVIPVIPAFSRSCGKICISKVILHSISKVILHSTNKMILKWITTVVSVFSTIKVILFSISKLILLNIKNTPTFPCLPLPILISQACVEPGRKWERKRIPYGWYCLVSIRWYCLISASWYESDRICMFSFCLVSYGWYYIVPIRWYYPIPQRRYYLDGFIKE